MLGVSPSAYEEACGILGAENAAAIMACILERAGHINSAGGYLRDLTRKAERAEFFARADADGANAAVTGPQGVLRMRREGAKAAPLAVEVIGRGMLASGRSYLCWQDAFLYSKVR